jgi:hypothetical protein
MRDRGTQPAQQPRQRGGDPKLLAARGQLDRLDAERHELRAARDRCKAEVGCNLGQVTEEPRHVGLVAGPAAPQHVGVDCDERLHASSR